jgi:protein ImuA
MRASAFMAGDRLAGLRRRIAEIEGRPVGLEVDRETGRVEASAVGKKSDSEGLYEAAARRGLAPSPSSPFRPRRSGAVLSLGIAPLDDLLAGGLRKNALHEIRGETLNDASAATGFAAALLARLTLADSRPILWVMEAAAEREGGMPYGAGLDRFGLDSKRLVIVRVRRPGEALWVFEEGLRCRGLAATIAEIRGHPKKLDLTASRRLALRARESGVMGLLLRQSGAAEPGAALTRWQVSPRPAATIDDFAAGIGRPVWRLALERNRLGATGTFDLEWDHGTSSFARPGPAHPLARPSLSPDRPHLSREAGTLVAFPLPSRRAAGDHRPGEERPAPRRAG